MLDRFCDVCTAPLGEMEELGGRFWGPVPEDRRSLGDWVDLCPGCHVDYLLFYDGPGCTPYVWVKELLHSQGE